jgi:hypothetical protein
MRLGSIIKTDKGVAVITAFASTHKKPAYQDMVAIVFKCKPAYPNNLPHYWLTKKSIAECTIEGVLYFKLLHFHGYI